MPGKLFILPSYYKELRFLSAEEGKIFLMYQIIKSKKELTKIDLFGKVLDKCRGGDFPGNMHHAYRTLRVLKVITDCGPSMGKSRVRFEKEISVKQLNRLLKKYNIEK